MNKDIRQQNKRAWEGAYENRKAGWGDDVAQRLSGEGFAYLPAVIVDALRGRDFAGRDIAQFCCNNGRELLDAMRLGARRGVGFDIAENMVRAAQETAGAASLPCDFVACDILEVPADYDGRFDMILMTIGAITWFEDLGALFAVVRRCLAPGGLFVLHDFHPFMNMLALPGEEGFDANDLRRVQYDYFRKEPWVETNGAGYMSGDYVSREAFTSFSHTTASIIGGAAGASLRVLRFDEYDVDVGLTDAYDGLGMPLSFLMVAERM